MVRRLFNAAIRGYHAVQRASTGSSHTAAFLAWQKIETMQAQERAIDPTRLTTYGFKGYSQNDEDGILQEIFRRIGTTNKIFIEFGCSDGLENNTVYLLLSGWSGIWIDGSTESVAKVEQMYASLVRCQRLRVARQYVTADNIDGLLAGLCPSKEIDLLSIDIDGNDYWIWSAIHSIYPRVVVIEYNATFRPPIKVVQKYAPNVLWDQTNFFGASLSALEELGRSKGYSLVACNLAGQNAFFVRSDSLSDDFARPFTAENHYMAANYDLYLLSTMYSHKPGVGEYIFK